MAGHSLVARLPGATPAAAALLASLLAGSLMAHAPAAGVAFLAAACYVPLVLLDLPLGLALWVAVVFLQGLPAVGVGPNAAALLIAFAWFGALRGRAEAVTAPLRRHRRLAAALMLLLGWLTLSLAWADRPDAVVDDLWQWYVGAAVLVVVSTTVTTPFHVRLVAGAFVLGAVASVGAGLVEQSLHGAGSALESATHTEGRLQGGGGDPNYLAAGLVPAMALAGGLLTAARSGLVRVALAAGVGLLALGLVQSASRGGLLAAVVTLAVAVLIQRGRRAHALVACAVVLSVAAAAFAATPGAWHRVTSLDGGGNGRADLWQVAWRVAGERPLVGVGLNNFRFESDEHVRRPGTLEFVELISERPHVVHNAYLQLLAEEGIVGLALYIAVALACLAAAWRAASRFEVGGSPALAALASSVVLAITGALTASFFISNATDKRLWVLLGLGPALLAVSERTADDGGGAS